VWVAEFNCLEFVGLKEGGERKEQRDKFDKRIVFLFI
jgi:hypothetical protein